MISQAEHEARHLPWEGPNIVGEHEQPEISIPDVRPLQCPDCGSPMPLNLKPEGWGDPGATPFVYLCERRDAGCRGLMSAHPDGLPQGTPVEQEIRTARSYCHRAFDPLWKQAPNMQCYQSALKTPQQNSKLRSIARKRAYHYMAAMLGRPEPQIHIAKITDLEMLRRFYAIAKQATPDLIRTWWKRGQPN